MPFVFANIFQPLIDVFEQVLLFFHDSVGAGWGMSIVLLTLSVRAVLLPLTIKQFKSMAALQRLAPEMKLLQEKYKEDKPRLNQEMMKFYQANKVNPFASCLPLLAQMPVFIALFYMLREDLKIDICGPEERITQVGALADTACEQVAPNSADFLFIPDLTDAATGGVLAILIVLYIGSQLISGIFMTTTVDKNQKRLMLALPFVFTIFIINFPAGLIVYWITTNFWTVGQGYFVRRSVGMPVPGNRNPEGYVAPGSPVPVLAGVGGGSKTAPPAPPRKKKKKTGRRR